MKRKRAEALELTSVELVIRELHNKPRTDGL